MLQWTKHIVFQIGLPFAFVKHDSLFVGVACFVQHLFEKLGGLRAFANAPFMALTALANSDVQKLIQSSLHMHYPVIVSQSLDRPNVFFPVGEIKGYTIRV